MEAKRGRIIKNVVQAAVVVTLGYVVRHKIAETQATAWIAAGWLLTAWVVLRLAMALKRGHANFRAHTATGINLQNFDKLTAASVPSWSRGYYQIEKAAYRGAWRTVTRKPLAPAGEFSVAGGAAGKRRAAGLLLLVLACAGLGAVCLPGLVTAFWPRVFAFVGAGYAALYAAIWIVGARCSLKEGGHRISGDVLLLDLGIRCSGQVALASIAACGVIAPGAQAMAAGDVWTVSPGERPNVLVTLHGATALAITSFGSPRDVSKRFIALYVDRPAAFADAVTQARCGSLRAAIA
jgi:hypothetical protein